MEHETYHIAEGQLCEGKQELADIKRTLSQKIHIYSGNLNKVGRKVGKRCPLSSTWWKQAKKVEKAVVYNNASNYFRNVCHALSHEVMWTAIKGGVKNRQMTIKGRWPDGFCSCNMRATNTFRDRTCLAYLIDVYIDPSIESWFRDHERTIDACTYALSQLLQWVWRSAIRSGNEIWLYLPSQRMRDFFTDWLGIERIA